MTNHEVDSRPRRSLSLGAKFVALIVVILALATGTHAYIDHSAKNRQFLDQLESKGAMLGGFVASISPQAILEYDFVTLNEYTRDFSRQQDIVYAVILSAHGDPMTSYIDAADPFVANAISEIGHNDMIEVVERVDAREDVLSMRLPIEFNGESLGTVAVGVDTTRAVQLSRQALTQDLAGSTATIIVLSILIYIVFRYNALHPIFHLIRGSERVARGKLDQEVDVSSNDELGNLTRAFNEMMRKLKHSTEEKDHALMQLRDLNRNLESRVLERTRELEVVNRELEHLALHDALTGLPNRVLFQDRVRQAILAAKREQEPLTIVMLDLDRFKEINDTLGHHVGDELLMGVAERLREAVRAPDTVGRLGGDEFGLLFPGTSVEQTLVVVRKIIESLEPRFDLDDIGFSVSGSFGIAAYPRHGKDCSTLLRCADVAMYVAKQRSRDYFVYDPDVDTYSPSRLALLGDLRTALSEDQLLLYYQPFVEMANNQTYAVEALIRWPHEVNGFIPPGEFIPKVEQTGLIGPLTRWVLDTAMRQWSEWCSQGKDVTVSINLSMRNVKDPELPDQLAALLGKWNMPARKLILEITESDVMSEPQHVLSILMRLEAMGVKLAIDDFGTGYSSLNYLKKLPVHILKIDRSFVTDVATNYDDAIIVRSTIDLAHNLGLKVVAEGVEDQQALDMLSALRCDIAQGYHVAAPMPAGEVGQFLHQVAN